MTGTCETVSESPWLPISTALQFVEAVFLCVCCRHLCFTTQAGIRLHSPVLWAVYKSYRSPADHARLSLQVQEDEASSVDLGDKDDGPDGGEARRGWWDYVPEHGEGKTRDLGPLTPPLPTPKDLVNRFRQWWTGAPVLPSTVFQRKPSTPGDLPIPQPRISTGSGANALSLRMSTTRDAERPSSPPPPSVMERIIRYVPRAELFRNMLRNEVSVSPGEQQLNTADVCRCCSYCTPLSSLLSSW